MIEFKKTLTIGLLFFIAFGHAQKRLTGTVMNSKNRPVSKVMIYLDTIDSGVRTDKKGHYSVEVSKDAKAINVYSYKYGLLSSEINSEQVINFVFIDTKNARNDNVRRGDKVDVTYSETEQKYIAIGLPTVKPEKNKDLVNYTSIYDLIRGRVAGVVVTQNNRIRIRGVNSPNSSSEPLFIVDGTPVFSIEHILPTNVRDIKVLKGPDASIYGSRGANGVIIIRTKS